MDRKLTLELLRIAVKKKLVGSTELAWKAEHWDRLEGYFHKITKALKEKWEGNLDGEGRVIIAPDIRTAKDFLGVSPEEIMKIRTSKSKRKGIPETNTQDYLVRVLDFSFDKLRDFEECVIALQLHPDSLEAEPDDILAKIVSYLKEEYSLSSSAPIHAKQTKTPLPESNVTPPVKFTSIFARRRKRMRVAATITLILGIVSVSGYTLRHLINWTGQEDGEQIATAPSKPQNSFSTEGDNSPIILTPGDVLFFGGKGKLPNDSSKIPEP